MSRSQLLLLAAGTGTRFGSDKRFATLPSGQRLWEAALEPYVLAGMSGFVVVREGEAEQFSSSLPTGFSILECSDASEGMSRSMACGLKHVSSEFVVIGLADMVYLSSSTVATLLGQIAKAKDLKAIYLTSGGKPGHPKAFHQSLFAEMVELRGDRGGKQVLKNLPPEHKKMIEVLDAGIHLDVDVPTDIDLTTD